MAGELPGKKGRMDERGAKTEDKRMINIIGIVRNAGRPTGRLGL